jgi:hypothetical protein
MKRKNISVKIMGWVFVGLVLLWVLALVFLFNFGHWMQGLVVLCLPFAVEYACRCYKAKKVILPHFKKKPVETPEIKPVLITSISSLTVSQFIQCYAYDNLNILGTGSHKQIKDCWNDLLGQYHAAIKNENMMQYIKLMRKRMAIELRKVIADKYCAMLKTMYSHHLAESLRKVFPKFKFEPDTVNKDLKNLQTSLIAEKIELDRINKELAGLNSANTKELTPEDKEAEIVDTLIEIRKHTGTNYDESTMTMLTYCRCLNRLYKHIENLQNQSQGNG